VGLSGEVPERRLVRWQRATGAALLFGYAGYYICRSNLSVALPSLLADPAAGVDRTAIGLVSSAGILAYAIGKSTTGVAGDFIGGRPLFLGGLFLSVAATLAFSASAGLTLFLGIWVVNRFVQSAGWGGLTKMAAHWFSARQYGTVMSVLSLSFLFGDAVGRYCLGALLSWGLGWRMVFVSAAAALAAIGVIDWYVLRNSPTELGLPEPHVHPDNLFGGRGTDSRPESLGALLAPYATSPSFWLVCGLSLGMTLIRESFNLWVPAYLVDAYELTPGLAARYSSLFPLVGGVSTLLVGVATDRFGGANRVTIVIPAMALCAASLGVLVIATERHDLALSLWAIGGTAFWLLGPYTLLAGAMAMDMGGRTGSATAAGLIDTAGYAGGTLSGVAVGRLAESGGWTAVFAVMAGVACLVLVVAVAYYLQRQRAGRRQTSFA
jgi:OPA family glycerol-3-phosphate transporter-like MFS transporter